MSKSKHFKPDENRIRQIKQSKNKPTKYKANLDFVEQEDEEILEEFVEDSRPLHL